VILLHSHGDALVHPAPWLAVAVFVIALAIGVPIGFTLGATALLYLYASGTVDPTAVPLTMQGSVDNFILLAVPFFILAGYVMTAGGLSEPLGSFVSSLVGQFRGGLLQVIVVTMYIFSGISGSKTADVAAVGTAMRSELDRQGYDRSESVAVLTSAAIMGETVPPSIALLILASLTSLSVGSLFLAGLFPAAVVGVCLMVGIYLRARSGGVAPPVQRVGWRTRSLRLVAAIPALAVPLILAGGILSGIATPTEASSIAVVYAVVVSFGLYRVRSVRLFGQLASTSAAMSGMILFIYSTASGLSWTVTAAGLVSKLANTLLGITHSQEVFLLGTVILLIVMGALLEGVPALVVLAPLLVPLAPDYGISPLHYGIVMIIAMGFGSFLPPLGLGVYVAASIYEVDLDRVARRMVPYLVAVFIGLLLVTYVPWFTTFVPSVFNSNG
jgi:tripartite ATP-independent transporter DctM subunit